ncbi:MAG TPA: methyltransferase domain-containing protein [Rhizomicrobium sp.]|jgi:2-polyprenyl-3-methyl-5-hydroxy-6-metoxy-1,4-benzoquinol methylase
MLASAGDIEVRARFHRLVYQFTSYNATILDFGAGTGIDAKAYAEKGHRVLVYEPCKENLSNLAENCRDELEAGTVAITDLAMNEPADVVAADFAVLNLIADHRSLFTTFDHLLAPNGYVVVNMLNPFFGGDARYRWWWMNIGALMQRGDYAVQGDDGPVYRFTPAAVARAASPLFHLIALLPGRLGLPFAQYMFLVFRKIT